MTHNLDCFVCGPHENREGEPRCPRTGAPICSVETMPYDAHNAQCMGSGEFVLITEVVVQDE